MTYHRHSSRKSGRCKFTVRWRDVALVYSVVAWFILATSAFADDAGPDFSAISNPNGNWSYGYIPTNGVFTLIPSSYSNDVIEGWYGDDGMEIDYNQTSERQSAGYFWWEGKEVAIVPGTTESGVVRWTAPTGGVYQVGTQYGDLELYGSICTVHLQHNGVSYADRFVNRDGVGSLWFVTNIVAAAAGDTIDFVVENGPGSGGGVIGIYHSVTPLASVNTDVRVSMVADRGTVTAGGSITYTITVVNAGSATVPTLTVTDTLPAELQVASAKRSPGGAVLDVSPNSITLHLTSFAAGQTAIIRLRANVSCLANAMDIVTNIASATILPFDLVTNNNAAAVVATIEPSTGPPQCFGHLQFRESLADSVTCPRGGTSTNGCALTTKGRFSLRATIPLVGDMPAFDANSPINIRVGGYSFAGTFGDDPLFVPGANHLTIVEQHNQCNAAKTSCRYVTDLSILARWTSSQMSLTITGQTPDQQSPILADQYRGDATSGISTSTTAEIDMDSAVLQIGAVNVVGSVKTKSVTTSSGQLSPSTIQLTGVGSE